MEIITSKANKLIKEISSLKEKKYREKLGMYFVEGEKCVLEATKLIPKKIKYIIATCDKSNLLKNCNFDIIYVSNDVFKSISETESPQNIAAVINLDSTTQFNFDDKFLILDHIQDPGNLGTIIRTAVATGFNNMVLINTVDPYSNKVVRSSSSGVFSINFYKQTYTELCNNIKSNNIQLFIAEASGSNIFKTKLELTNNFGLVIGSEGQGVSDEILSLKHTSISLPMENTMESLNAAVSASVIMYNLVNR